MYKRLSGTSPGRRLQRSAFIFPLISVGSQGADCNVLDGSGRTALHNAVLNNKFDVVGSILKIDPAAKGRLKSVRCDEFGAPDIDFQEEQKGGTALHLAVWNKCTEMCKLIASHGASKVAEDKSFKRPVDYAVDYSLMVSL